MFHFLEGTATGTMPGGDMTMTIVMLVAMIAVFYFMLIRPENKRKKEAEQLRSNMKNGDTIITIGGITGTVVDIKEDRFVIETGADRVRLELMKWALSSNETAAKQAAEQAKKTQEAKAKAKAEKKAKKTID